jgi:acyl-CoA thioesterase-1
MIHSRPFSFLIAVTLFFSTFGLNADQTKKAKRLVVLGDSLTEGYGVAQSSAFPALLQELLRKEGFTNWSVINAGVSGATSASAKPRLKWQLKTKPDFIILALGANDGLRGISPQVTAQNLSAAIEELQKNKIPVLLAGLQMPPNYGGPYRKEYADVFPQLAKKYNLPLIPFLLEGVAGVSSLNLADGIHPNEKGHKIIAENVLSVLKKLILN